MQYNKLYTIIIFVFMALISLVFIHSVGTIDVPFWLDEKWVPDFEKYGYIQGFIKTADTYPPLSYLLVGLSGKCAALFAVKKLVAFKVMLLLFLCANTLVFYYYTRDKLLTLLLHGALIVNSVLLGYLDILMAPFMIIAFFALKDRKYLLFSIAFFISVMMKFQPLIFAPFILLHLLTIRDLRDFKSIDYKNILKKCVLPVAVLFIGGLLVFGSHFYNPFFRASRDTFLSGNALNFNWIYTFILHNLFPQKFNSFGGYTNGIINVIDTNLFLVRVIPKVIFFGLFGYVFYKYVKQEKTIKNLLVVSIVGYVTYFMFNTGVHENHLLPLCVLFVVLIYFDRTYILDGLVWIIVFNINMLVFYGFDRGLPFSRIICGIDITLLLSIVFLLLYVLFVLKVIRQEFQQA